MFAASACHAAPRKEKDRAPATVETHSVIACEWKQHIRSGRGVAMHCSTPDNQQLLSPCHATRRPPLLLPLPYLVKVAVQKWGDEAKWHAVYAELTQQRTHLCGLLDPRYISSKREPAGTHMLRNAHKVGMCVVSICVVVQGWALSVTQCCCRRRTCCT